MVAPRLHQSEIRSETQRTSSADSALGPASLVPPARPREPYTLVKSIAGIAVAA